MNKHKFKSRNVFCSLIDESVEQSFKYEVINSAGMQGDVLLTTSCEGPRLCNSKDCSLILEYGGKDYSEPF